MSYYCTHGQVVGRCTEGCSLGYAPPPPPPPKLNVDRFGLPRDYATYMWLLYREVVDDQSPERLAFLNGPKYDGVPDFGQQVMYRW